jgi:hypothetical protein
VWGYPSAVASAVEGATSSGGVMCWEASRGRCPLRAATSWSSVEVSPDKNPIVFSRRVAAALRHHVLLEDVVLKISI